MNNMAIEKLKEYQRKRTAGEVEAPVIRTPKQKAEDNPKSMRLAINAHCWDCSGESKPEVGRCAVTNCALYNFRPWQKKKGKSCNPERAEDLKEVNDGNLV